MRGPLLGFAVEVEHPTGDKYTRALPMSSAAVRGPRNRLQSAGAGLPAANNAVILGDLRQVAGLTRRKRRGVGKVSR